MYKINFLDKLSFILVIIGAVNWGLIGLFNLNLVKILALNNFTIERIVYILVFAAALNLITVIIRSKLFNN